MATEIEICNSAIAKVRGKRILTLSDNTTEARLLTDLYPRVRDRVLRAHPWNCTKARFSLAADATAPEWGYNYRYPLPPSCLRVLKTNIPTDIDWELESDSFILTDYTDVKIQTVQRVAAEKFDASLAEVIAYALAKELAYPLTQSASLLANIDAGMKDVLREARSFNAQERGSIQQVESSQWLDSRF